MRIGRCNCGCVGCDDVIVDICSEADNIQWDFKGRTFRFPVGLYSKILVNLITNHSWENIGRRVERLISNLISKDSRWPDETLRFDWVSTRISPYQLTYSFTNKGKQKIFSAGWDGLTEDDALNAHNRLFYELF